MPTGVYYRSPELMKQIQTNLNKGRSPKVRAKVRKILKENAKDPEWRKKVAAATKEALNRPEVREKYLRNFMTSCGYDYDTTCRKIPRRLKSLLIPEEYARKFWSRVQIGKKNECWPFLGHLSEGYGRFWIGDEEVTTHRLVAEMGLGRRLQRKEQALHKCDNPPCCNPNHIYVGNHTDNMKDRKDRNRIRNRYTGKVRPRSYR